MEKRIKRQGLKVKELSVLSGISIRTLHHYDQIGLLKPTKRTEAGYRFYEERELLRLQQILFYKELGFPLKEIKVILDDPDFDLLGALNSHAQSLKIKQKRISTLLKTIKQTIKQLKEGKIMSNPENLYEGLPEKYGKEYRQKVIQEYGQEALTKSEEALSQLGKEGMKKLQLEMESLTDQLFEFREQPPESEQVQLLISKHYQVIRKFWGTLDSQDKQAEDYAGLGNLYVNDDRFMSKNGEARPVFASFMEQAMGYFAKNQLGLDSDQDGITG